jgi:hypothetical protein
VRRVGRYILNGLAVLSLLLCVATGLLWIWSNHTRWQRIDIGYRKVTNLLADDGHPYLAAIRHRGMLFEGGSIVVYRLSSLEDVGARSAWEINERVVGRNLREAGQWYWTASQPDVFGNPDQYAEAGVRTILVVTAFALLPALWYAAVVRRGRRSAQGHCRICGYDLRATPDRCPECGFEPPARV